MGSVVWKSCLDIAAVQWEMKEKPIKLGLKRGLFLNDAHNAFYKD